MRNTGSNVNMAHCDHKTGVISAVGLPFRAFVMHKAPVITSLLVEVV